MISLCLLSPQVGRMSGTLNLDELRATHINLHNSELIITTARAKNISMGKARSHLRLFPCHLMGEPPCPLPEETILAWTLLELHQVTCFKGRSNKNTLQDSLHSSSWAPQAKIWSWKTPIALKWGCIIVPPKLLIKLTKNLAKDKPLLRHLPHQEAKAT